jgi:hypothetical protein
MKPQKEKIMQIITDRPGITLSKLLDFEVGADDI